MPLSESERSIRGSIAVNTSWANTSDRSARTAPARRAFDERFKRQVDPNNELPEAERNRRAESAKRAYYGKLALASAKARRLRKAGK